MQVLLASPRGFCAGVVRAIEIVELALDLHGPPIYVLHEIVHNQRVVRDLQARGAVFVQALDEIPSGAVTIFSAHGVPASIAEQAKRKRLNVIDATCPLVTKVHLEVARHARAGREVVLVGHAGHPEVIGTLGRYDRSAGGEVYLIETVDDVWKLRVRNPREIAVVTQTTLSVDDTRRIIAALRERFPTLLEPRQADICYATQNRQNAVRRLAGRVDLLLVVGAHNSSNSNRLREVGRQMGFPAYLVQDAAEVDEAWLQPGMRVGVTAGASTPEVLVEEVLSKLARLGVAGVSEVEGEVETTTFRLPPALARTPPSPTESRPSGTRATSA
ncbi:MAG TPA: 4-hydroxy-3-methylbut-2-enyl diphosphate reductase [Burkholderiales bacterium]|nr:4-hydroxy-3-methylbut-2-enyl diphosphate reductase [Burkholderiales bacterium]